MTVHILSSGTLMTELDVFIFTVEDRCCSQMYFLLVRSCIVNLLVEKENTFYFKILITYCL